MNVFCRLAFVFALLTTGSLSIAMPDATFSVLFAELEDASFSDDKLEVVKRFAGQALTETQAVRILKEFPMSDDKLSALRLIAGGIPQTAMGAIGKAFSFDDDRAEARKILAAKGATTHASGTQSATAGGKNRCASYSLSNSGQPSDGTMPRARFQQLESTVKGESFSDSKVGALRTFLEVAPEGLSAEQVTSLITWYTYRDDKLSALRAVEDRVKGLTAAEMKALIGGYTFSDDKLEVLKIVKDTLLDLDNRYDVVDAFTFRNDKEEARQILSKIQGRTYLWGTVRASKPVFVLDTSGSMRASGRLPDGSQGTRLDFLKKEMTDVLEHHIGQGDQFEIITFNGSVLPLNRKMVSGSDKNRARASQMISRTRANGGTNIHDALERAFALPNTNAVYLLTDGMPSAGRFTNTAQIRNAVLTWNATKGIPLHTVALLTGGSGSSELEASRFMFELALQNCGQFRLIR